MKTASGLRFGLVNLVGRVYMEPCNCPFECGAKAIDTLRAQVPVVIVDFHAEATAEKIALGWHLDGRCTAVLGTHTHVTTADERVLPQGTAYITDVGMTGPLDGVIGIEREPAIEKFMTGMPKPYKVAGGTTRFNGVLVEADDATGRALRIRRISRCEPRQEP